MSAATQSRIFGIRLGVDPKILVLALMAVAGLLFWYNSREGAESSSSAPARTEPAALPPIAAKNHSLTDRRRGLHNNNDRGTLRLRAVDPTRGDIDPVLRLDFISRLQKVQAPSSIRNLFEAGPATPAGTAAVPTRIIPVKAPIAPPPLPAYPVPSQMAANIPFKYYGFAKPVNAGDGSRGFFMEGDNILVAIEGQLLQSRYLVVQLSPNTAKVEDTQAKLSQTLQVVPEAMEQGSGAPRPIQPEPNPGFNNQPTDDNQ